MIKMGEGPYNPFKDIDIACVFKDFHFEFKHTDPDRPKNLCPYGNHELQIAENVNRDSFFDVSIDLLQISFGPQVPSLILGKEKCQSCGELISATILPLPPTKVWTKENWNQFYSDLLGSEFRTGKRFEALRQYIQWDFPFKDFSEVLKELNRVAEEAMRD